MNLSIRNTFRMGRGVFANRNFKTGEIIEVCPVLILPDDVNIPEYAFDFFGKGALALGYGSLYNHSSKPNAFYNPNYKKQEIIIIACKDISAKSQIFLDYGWNEDDLKMFFKNKP